MWLILSPQLFLSFMTSNNINENEFSVHRRQPSRRSLQTSLWQYASGSSRYGKMPPSSGEYVGSKKLHEGVYYKKCFYISPTSWLLFVLSAAKIINLLTSFYYHATFVFARWCGSFTSGIGQSYAAKKQWYTEIC